MYFSYHFYIAVKVYYNFQGVFKKPPARCTIKQRKGCRCGNATATPGKLTCCGQRCPCYVESKACIECKCRGCRNPHTPDGNKVRWCMVIQVVSLMDIRNSRAYFLVEIQYTSDYKLFL